MNEPHSLLLLGFGQSNMEIFPAGPCLFPSADHVAPIVCPDDSLGVRGHIGGRVAKGRGPDDPITGFSPITTTIRDGQFLLTAAGETLYHAQKTAGLERVIVRSEARGGRPLIGYTRDDGKVVEGIFKEHDGTLGRPFQKLLSVARQIKEAASQTGAPIRTIYLIWAHGEADRSTDKATYLATLNELIDRVEATLADLGVPITWMFIQPAGTNYQGSGNRWDNRLALLDISDARTNAHTCSVGYWTPLEDGIHYHARGRVLLGEHVGRMVAKCETGGIPEAPRCRSAALLGDRLTLTFTADAPLILDKDAAVPHEPAYGFRSFDKSRAVITDVKVCADNQVQLTFNHAPDHKSLEIAYAHRTWGRNDDVNDGAIDLPIGRGALRTTFAGESAFIPETQQHDWVASFAATPTTIKRLNATSG